MPQQIPAVSMGFLNCLRALSQAWSHELLSGSSYDAIIGYQYFHQWLINVYYRQGDIEKIHILPQLNLN